MIQWRQTRALCGSAECCLRLPGRSSRQESLLEEGDVWTVLKDEFGSGRGRPSSQIGEHGCIKKCLAFSVITNNAWGLKWRLYARCLSPKQALNHVSGVWAVFWWWWWNWLGWTLTHLNLRKIMGSSNREWNTRSGVRIKADRQGNH